MGAGGMQGSSWLPLGGSVMLNDVKAAGHGILDLRTLSFSLAETAESLTTQAVAVPSPHLPPGLPCACSGGILAAAHPLLASGRPHTEHH